MSPDLRKVWLVATTEFGSAVRAKSFIISILLLPFIMGASVLLQIAVAERADTKPRRFVVLDHTGVLLPVIIKAAEAHNAQLPDVRAKNARPRMEPQPVPQPGQPDSARLPGTSLAVSLSDHVRRGELDAYIEIPAGVIEAAAPGDKLPAIAYHSNNPNDDILRNWLTQLINNEIRARRFRSAGLDQALAERLSQPVSIDNLELVEQGSDTSPGGMIKSAEKVDPIRTKVVPAVLLFVMFFVIKSSAPQLLNSVIEEKMSRISEVLLGSVTPFELMMGKLLGNAGIAMLLATLYVGRSAQPHRPGKSCSR